MSVGTETAKPRKAGSEARAPGSRGQRRLRLGARGPRRHPPGAAQASSWPREAVGGALVHADFWLSSPL